MTIISNHKRSLLVFLGLLFLSLSLTGCSGGLLGNANWPGLSVDDQNVYISLGQYVHVVDVETGNEVCRFPREAERGVTFFAPPAPIEENLVIVGDFNGTVYGFDSSDGCQEIWQKEIGDDYIVGRPVVFDETVLIPSADGTLYALEFDSNLASVLWEFPTQSALWSSPLVSDDVIYQSSMDHHVYAITPQGELIWEADLGAAVLDTPTESDDMILVGTFGNQLVALDKNRGTVIWSFDTEAWVYGNPLVLDGVAYFGDVDGNLYSIDVNSGRQVRNPWKADGAITASPVAMDDLFYFTTETGTLYARTGSSFAPNWEQSLSGGLYSDPVILNGNIFISVISDDAPLQVLSAESSSKIWSFLPPSEE